MRVDSRRFLNNNNNNKGNIAMPGRHVCPLCYLSYGEHAPCQCKNSQNNISVIRCPHHPALRFADDKSARDHIADCQSLGLPSGSTRKRPSDAPYARSGGLPKRLGKLHDPNREPRPFPLAQPVQPEPSIAHLSGRLEGMNLFQKIRCPNCSGEFPHFPAFQEHFRYC